jgi:predicted  nucleic acid-binding Zn-ribbon protein
MATKEDPSPLVAAAIAFDAELERFASLSETLLKARLDSEKGLERAAGALTEVAACEQQLGARAQALMTALGAARDRQQTQANGLSERAEEIQRRSQEFQDLLDRFQEIGKDATELSTLGQEIGAMKRVDKPASDGEVLGRLDQLNEKMASLVARAEALSEDAKTASFPELSRRAHDLRQQILSARNKINLLQQKLTS